MRHFSKRLSRPVLLSVTLACIVSGCKTIPPDSGTPADAPIAYRDDTPEHLVDSYLIAWNEYDDGPVYHFRTPLKGQNTAEREAFIQNGAEKCRWHAEYWAIVNETVSEDGQSATLDIQMVESSEGSTTLCMLRFDLAREGDRWLVREHEWVGEYVPLRNYPDWIE